MDKLKMRLKLVQKLI